MTVMTSALGGALCALVLCQTRTAGAQDVDLRALIKAPKLVVSYAERLPFKVAIGLNDNVAVLRRVPPFTSIVMLFGKDGQPTVTATHSSQTSFQVLDYKSVRGIMGYSAARGLNNLYTNFVISEMRQDLKPFYIPTIPRELDAHEPVLSTARGNVFLYYMPRKYDDGVELIEAQLREYDVDGRLLWEWESKRPSTIDMEKTKRGKFDYLHVNSVSEYDTYYVLSARNTSQLLLVDKTTKEVPHRIGKDGNWTFKDDPLNGFGWQHHAAIDKNGYLTLFDNGGSYDAPWTREGSRAVRYKLDFATRTATLVESLPIYGPLKQRTRQGSATFLDSGYRIVSWGVSEPAACNGVTELPVVYSVYRGAKVVADVRASCGWYTYRAQPVFD